MATLSKTKEGHKGGLIFQRATEGVRHGRWQLDEEEGRSPTDPGHAASKTSKSTAEALQIQLGLRSCNQHPRPRRLDSRIRATAWPSSASCAGKRAYLRGPGPPLCPAFGTAPTQWPAAAARACVRRHRVQGGPGLVPRTARTKCSPWSGAGPGPVQAADGRPVCLRTRVRTCWPVGTDQETFQLESDRLTEKVHLLHPFGRMLDAGRRGRMPSTASTQDASSYFDVEV
uniref:Uncharacterized protein n=1 Tax=Rangifer tarandus platyrhynchus TaxID=3082113 RepID=A0ACB0FDM8_RANTA|nr:unnamed protein product [Rangifer tarandus platyrhynchus]